MTPKMKRLYEFIKTYITAHDYPPCYLEMMKGTGVKSKSEIFRLLGCLEKRGHIERSFGSARGIRIKEPKVDNRVWIFLSEKGLATEFAVYMSQ